MKILIFSWRDIKNPDSGGAETLTHQLARRWVKKGHPVHLISAKFPQAKDEEIIEGVKIFRPASFYKKSFLDYINYFYKTVSFYRKNLSGKYDIVIDQVHGLPFFTPLYAKEKVILFPLEVAKSIWFYEVPFPFSLIGFLEEWLYINLFRHVPFLTISSSTARELTELGVKQVFTITPGVDFKPLSKLAPKSEFPLLVSLGRITQMKRVGDTLQAFRLLHKEFPFIRFVVIGRGKKEYLKELRILCRKMAIEDRVTFLGFISKREKRKLLKQAWLLVSTSLKEGWGLIVIEAATCGTPTIAYKVPGLIDSIKHGQTGILCKKQNSVELARNIRKLLIDHNLRKQLSQNALDYSRGFSWDKTAEEGLKILKKISNSVYPIAS